MDYNRIHAYTIRMNHIYQTQLTPGKTLFQLLGGTRGAVDFDSLFC